jgi:ABC-2 type transport system ATP-binding protein
MTSVVRLSHVTKRYRGQLALDDVSLEVPPGVVVALLGENGAGKTTALRILLGLVEADAGEAEVLNIDSRRQGEEIRRLVGYVPERPTLYEWMTIAEIGWFAAGFYRGGYLAKYRELVKQFKLPEDRRIKQLSKGMRGKVSLALAMAHEPELLILDEPFSGLDPLSVRVLKEIVADEQRRGATIIFSTHVMAHAEDLCEQIVMIHKGRKVLDEPMSGLRRQYDTRTIRLEPLDATTDLMALKSVSGVERVQLTDEGCEIGLVAGTEPAAAIRNIAGTVAPARIELVRVRLEDMFIRIVGGGSGSEESRQALRTHLQGLSGVGVAS